MIEIELCLFNSLTQYTPQGTLRLAVPKGTEARELPDKLRIPAGKIFAAWRNGRDIMTTFGGVLQQGIMLQDGDRLALSGPIPFSRGYGCPVC
jgi:hypothetical protein